MTAAQLQNLSKLSFAAIDFETADPRADSACAIGVVRVENLRVVARRALLIKPPRSRILYTRVHGITAAMVAKVEPFAPIWQSLAPLVDGVSFLVAHNAAFDRRILHGCCLATKLPRPPHKFVCTVNVAVKHLRIRPANLASVCARLNIPLVHHNAGSDAEACARILIAAAGGEHLAPMACHPNGILVHEPRTESSE